MNQILKDKVYNRGTKKQALFLAEIGGMNDEEKEIFLMMHEGKTDLFIQEEFALSRRAFDRIEEAISAKLLLAVFECITHYQEYLSAQ